jgi:hypothetical protein
MLEKKQRMELDKLAEELRIPLADTFQIWLASSTRFIRKIGEIARGDMNRIIAAIGLVVEYPALS